ncbi:MAG: NUDIX hydrolase [Candidatus Aenigmarchaeota archaeon]|nr:NUDIX hydrolase [Candidatus Aenigmarchaeota archaeon]
MRPYGFGMTADIIVERNNEIVLIKRMNEPYKGSWEIPGGFVEEDETVEEAALREVTEETSLKVKLKEILGVYSDVNRDSRGRVATVVFITEAVGGKLKASSDAEDAKWFDVDEIDADSLGFDHPKILNDYKKWKKQKGTYWSGR